MKVKQEYYILKLLPSCLCYYLIVYTVYIKIQKYIVYLQLQNSQLPTMEASSENTREMYILGSKNTPSLLASRMELACTSTVWSHVFSCETFGSCFDSNCSCHVEIITSCCFSQQEVVILTNFHLGQLNGHVFSAVSTHSC